MRAALALCLALCLSGCMNRYVKVPCLTKEEYQERQRKEPHKVGGGLTGDAQKDNRIIAGSAKELRVWGVGNLDILGGCVG